MINLYKIAKEKFNLSGQSDVAKCLNQSPQTLNNWESRGMSKSGILLASKAFKCDANWLESGTELNIQSERGSSNTSAKKSDENWLETDNRSNHNNTEPARNSLSFVPLIPWVSAGSWNQVMKVEAEDFVPCLKSHNGNAYALRVTSDSMSASCGKSYPEGCVIVVDNDLKSPESGDKVIAKIPGDSNVVFRVFMQEGSRTWLKTLNAGYTLIYDQFEILGTVIGKWEDG